MSKENVEIVREAYEAANRGDFEAATAYAHPEIESHTYAQAPEAGIYHGRQAVQSYNEALIAQFESIRYDVEEIRDAGDRVLVLSTQRAVPKGGGHEIAVHVAEIWTIRDGLLAERRSYATKEEAMEAAGLSEE